MKRRYIWGPLVGIGLLVFFLLDPARCPLFPRCPFFTLTGYQCPGCGSQRAIHDLLHLNLAGALAHNALLVVCVPLLALMFYAQRHAHRHARLYHFLNGRSFILLVLAVIIAWWILRNLCL